MFLCCIASKYHNGFGYVIDGMMILALFFNADIHAIFLALCSFCYLNSLRLKIDFEFTRPKTKVNAILQLRNNDVTFCNFVCLSLLSLIRVNLI